MFKKSEIYKYLKKRHLKDGGYFFARVLPSSGLDTYLAVKTLCLLGLRPENPESIIKFWQNEKINGNLDDLNGLFYATQCYKELGYLLEDFKDYRKSLLSAYQNRGFYRKKNIYLPSPGLIPVYNDIIEGEAKSAFYLASLLSDLKIDFEKKALIEYASSLQNKDGGFGSIKGSDVSTTYYCLKILELLGQPFPQTRKIGKYLVNQFQSANYLEEYHWATEGLALLKKKIPDKNEVLLFLFFCYRGNGGFSRSQFIGIPTIEYTYQAVSILIQLEKQNVSVFDK